jgi:hypothetical protein
MSATILFAHTANISLSKRGHQVLKDKKEDITEKPESGCIIYGLFLEGAKWDEEHMMVAESSPKELFVTFPLMWFIPETLRPKPTEGIARASCFLRDAALGCPLPALVRSGHVP